MIIEGYRIDNYKIWLKENEEWGDSRKHWSVEIYKNNKIISGRNFKTHWEARCVLTQKIGEHLGEYDDIVKTHPAPKKPWWKFW